MSSSEGALVLNSGSQVVLTQRALVNTGTATFAGPPSALGLQSGATFTNQAGGTVVLANDSSLLDFGGLRSEERRAGRERRCRRCRGQGKIGGGANKRGAARCTTRS